MATTSVKISKSEMVYNFTFNVPEMFTYSPRKDLFVECRAQFCNIGQNNEIVFFVDIEHLNVFVCSNINWQKVQPIIYDIAKIHFETLINYADR